MRPDHTEVPEGLRQAAPFAPPPAASGPDALARTAVLCRTARETCASARALHQRARAERERAVMVRERAHMPG